MNRFMIFALMLSATVFPLAVNAQPKPQGPVPVIVAAAKQDSFADKIEALGTLRANEGIIVTSTVTDTVSAIHFDDGQRVEKDAVLVEMTNGEESALLEEAQSEMNEAWKQMERLKPLVEQGASSKSLLDEKRREYQTAKARLDATKSRLSDRLITAPFAGVVGLRDISAGALIQPGTKITTLDDDSVMKLDFAVPSIFLPVLKPGLEIEAKAKGFEDHSFNGEIISIDSQVDPVTRAVMVRAMIPNDGQVLKPGLLMSVELLRSPRESIVVPEEALELEGSKAYVYVVNEDGDGHVIEKREVKTGTRRPGDVEITDGLEDGELVVTHGTLSIRDGAAVTIRAEEKDNETLDELLKQGGSPAEKAD